MLPLGDLAVHVPLRPKELFQVTHTHRVPTQEWLLCQVSITPLPCALCDCIWDWRRGDSVDREKVTGFDHSLSYVPHCPTGQAISLVPVRQDYANFTEKRAEPL